jgi:predicted phage replisome organizer
MAEVKWVKLTTDMFDNRKIKHLRKLPDGNNIVLIWVMLLTMAGRCNAGGMIFLTENIPYTPKMLADELGFEENTVILALQALENLNMVVKDEGFFVIAGWEEYQNIEGMDKIREQNRIRKQKQRENQALLGSMSRDSHVTVTVCHATDIDKDIDKDKEKRKKKESTYDGILSEIANDDLRGLYLEYIKMRKMIKAPMTDRALTMLINKVNELEPNSIDNQKRLLETAIMNNWKSVYPLKDAGKTVRQQDKQPSKQEEELLKMFGGG